MTPYRRLTPLERRARSVRWWLRDNRIYAVLVLYLVACAIVGAR